MGHIGSAVVQEALVRSGYRWQDGEEDGDTPLEVVTLLLER